MQQQQRRSHGEAIHRKHHHLSSSLLPWSPLVKRLGEFLQNGSTVPCKIRGLSSGESWLRVTKTIQSKRRRQEGDLKRGRRGSESAEVSPYSNSTPVQQPHPPPQYMQSLPGYCPLSLSEAQFPYRVSPPPINENKKRVFLLIKQSVKKTQHTVIYKIDVRLDLFKSLLHGESICKGLQRSQKSGKT